MRPIQKRFKSTLIFHGVQFVGPRFFCTDRLVLELDPTITSDCIMEESEYDEDKKVKITSQPIFWVAMLLVVFNVCLYFWSVNRSSESENDQAVEQLEKE